MAIDVKQLTTEITLELDREELPINEFAKALENFFGLIKEVTKLSVPGKDPSGWLVKVYPGSAGIGVTGKHYTGEEVAYVKSNISSGLYQLERGERHPMFTDKAVEHSRKLSSLFYSKKTISNTRIWIGREQSVNITKTMSAKAAELLEPHYEDDGSVDGFLEKLNAHGQFEFVVYDPLDNRAITCEVEESKIGEAWTAWRKRVEVIGKVRYRRDGLPVSVKATEIIPFPSKEEIPTLSEIRTLLGGN